MKNNLFLRQVALILLGLPLLLGWFYANEYIETGLYDWVWYATHSSDQLLRNGMIRFLVNFWFWTFVGLLPSALIAKKIKNT